MSIYYSPDTYVHSNVQVANPYDNKSGPEKKQESLFTEYQCIVCKTHLIRMDAIIWNNDKDKKCPDLREAVVCRNNPICEAKYRKNGWKVRELDSLIQSYAAGMEVENTFEPKFLELEKKKNEAKFMKLKQEDKDRFIKSIVQELNKEDKADFVKEILKSYSFIHKLKLVL